MSFRMQLITFVLSAVEFNLYYAVTADCIFRVTNNETEKYLPVPLYNTSSEYDLAIPHEGLIHLQKGQNISLSCSGQRNYVRQTNSNVTSVTCLENDKVKLYRQTYKFEQIQCKRIVKGSVRSINETCGNNEGIIHQIGYPVTKCDWVTLITLCYQPKIGNTLFSQHTLHGREIKFASKNKYRPGFSTAGENENITASLVYKQTYQKSTFSSILGSSRLANNYINTKSYLARGHLSPDADFLLATAQFSTYYYVNAAPQWQSINNANWKSVENTVRILAVNYGDLNIITGTFGVLSYNDVNDNLKEIYLGINNILPVPKYFWKVAYDIKTQKGIAFVVVNDPYVKSVNEDVFCEDICIANGFTKKSWKEISTGYVFCCSVSDFRHKVKTLPKLDVSGILTIDQSTMRYLLEEDL
ncbi:unnamed protein product [Ceutorhynchus assimilis]|uniref:DNA/RNA non-specific endonuclease domain-containing protein n=1 Tax=Ceutorhynchus assimilis TaxID=467358 RepID=A0A9N9MQA7_9CUCU|nr:unnamed protein product [Ceutorhynchus assimilis]